MFLNLNKMIQRLIMFVQIFEGSYEFNTSLKHLNHPNKAQCKAHYDDITLSYMESQRKKAAVEKIQEWKFKNKKNISSYSLGHRPA